MNLSNSRSELWNLFAGNDYLYGFKYDCVEIDAHPIRVSVSNVRYIAECVADHAEYLHKMAYPCIFLKIEDTVWHFLATKEHAQGVLDDIKDMLNLMEVPANASSEESINARLFW